MDSGLTLNYLLKNLRGRRPASLEVCALLKKTGIQRVHLDVKYVGFEIPPDFVVGYGLDFAERFRNLPVRRAPQARGVHRRLSQERAERTEREPRRARPSAVRRARSPSCSC